MIQVSAVILAGGTNSAKMIAATGVQNRALVELKPGRTMLSYVLKAVEDARSVSSVVVVGNVPTAPGTITIPAGPAFLQNLINGVKAAQQNGEKVLIVTSDIPFITGPAIDDFVQTALHSRGDFCYPIIPMDVYRKTFAKMKRTTLKLADGEFTGGNIMLVNSGFIINNQKTINAAYAARKDVFKLGGMLGWDLLARVVVSQLGFPTALDIRSLEDGVSRLLGKGANAKAVISEFASLGTDIDKPDDVEAARLLLGRL